MRVRPVWGTITILGALGVVVSFLIKEGRSNADQWMSIVSGLITIIGLLRTFIFPGAAPAAAAEMSATTPLERCALHLENGRLPSVSELSDSALGVKPAIQSSGGADEIPAYLARAHDSDLEWAVAAGGVVLVHGRAASGKTRSAAETVRRLRGGHQLLAPVSGQALRALVDAGYELRDTVVWLDDVERYLVAGGIDQNVLDRLCPRGRADITVVATIRGEELARFDRAASIRDEFERGGPVRAAVDVLQRITGRRRVLVKQYLTEVEAAAVDAAADDRVAAAAAASSGFAEYLAAGPAMVRRWQDDGDRIADVGQALISAAVDCRRAGYHSPVGGDLLGRLGEHYLNPALRGRADLPSVAEGLQWAAQPVLGASSCLQPRAGDCYLASDYLVDRAESGEGPRGRTEIPPQVWDALLGMATADERADIAGAAFFSGQLTAAFDAVLPLAEGGDGAAMMNIGLIEFQRGSAEEAERWWLRAAEAGSAGGMHNLALLYGRKGDQEKAELWYRRAAEAGEASAMHNLAFLLAARDEKEESTFWYRQGAAAGSAEAMHNLGLICLHEQRYDEAATWLTSAFEAGNLRAAHSLGVLHNAEGRDETAATWWLRAATADEQAVEPRFNLGQLFYRQGRHDDAMRWWQQAAELGDAQAMVNLANVHFEADRPATAKRWWQRAAAVGDAQAMYNLGVLAHRRGDVDEARSWYERAAQAGDADAALLISGPVD
ncbi:SEL1-like repeat protein [Symbioplanes lichenis]|uniref:SEL1-like repeat protein n=1 Tax=Symbioplanes lichenis TaxID=1629072 RepID=UPI002739FBBF|nr:SEL1-like repeat protein [Actinoplanes lichenis]